MKVVTCLYLYNWFTRTFHSHTMMPMFNEIMTSTCKSCVFLFLVLCIFWATHAKNFHINRVISSQYFFSFVVLSVSCMRLVLLFFCRVTFREYMFEKFVFFFSKSALNISLLKLIKNYDWCRAKRGPLYAKCIAKDSKRSIRHEMECERKP